MKQRRTYHFTGHVQGVGFRYSTQTIAARHAVSGYVRNLPDGRVELVLEAEPAEMDRMIADLSQHMAGHIKRIDCDESPATGDLQGFEIRH